VEKSRTRLISGFPGTIRGPASAKVGDLASDERLRDELVSMRFVETHRHVTVVGSRAAMGLMSAATPGQASACAGSPPS
jgi:hypothetical protein